MSMLKTLLTIDVLNIFSKIFDRWMPQYANDVKLALIHVLARFCHVTNHHQGPFWPMAWSTANMLFC